MPSALSPPRRFRRVAVALAAALLLPARLPAADDPGGPEIKDALRDGTGRVWGIAGKRPAGLYLLGGDGRWQDATPTDADEPAQPCGLGLRADGTVVCVWRVGERRYRSSTHHGADSRTGPDFTLSERRYGQDLRITADAKNNLWLTQEGPDIYRLAPDGTVVCAHTLSERECLPGTFVNEDPASVWNTVSAFEDAGGRLWFWTDHADGGSNGATVRGALVCADGKFVQHDLLLPGGAAQASLTVLTPKDARHLWLARRFDGLYTLDTATFRAERVPDQPGEASLTSRASRGTLLSTARRSSIVMGMSASTRNARPGNFRRGPAGGRRRTSRASAMTPPSSRTGFPGCRRRSRWRSSRTRPPRITREAGG